MHRSALRTLALVVARDGSSSGDRRRWRRGSALASLACDVFVLENGVWKALLVAVRHAGLPVLTPISTTCQSASDRRDLFIRILQALGARRSSWRAVLLVPGADRSAAACS